MYSNVHEQNIYRRIVTNYIMIDRTFKYKYMSHETAILSKNPYLSARAHLYKTRSPQFAWNLRISETAYQSMHSVLIHRNNCNFDVRTRETPSAASFGFKLRLGGWKEPSTGDCFMRCTLDYTPHQQRMTTLLASQAIILPPGLLFSLLPETKRSEWLVFSYLDRDVIATGRPPTVLFSVALRISMHKTEEALEASVHKAPVKRQS